MTSSFETKHVERALTERERQIAALVCTGDSYKEIARQMGVSQGTVKHHVHNIFQKFGVKSRAQLIYRLIA